MGSIAVSQGQALQRVSNVGLELARCRVNSIREDLNEMTASVCDRFENSVVLPIQTMHYSDLPIFKMAKHSLNARGLLAVQIGRFLAI